MDKRTIALRDTKWIEPVERACGPRKCPHPP